MEEFERVLSCIFQKLAFVMVLSASFAALSASPQLLSTLVNILCAAVTTLRENRTLILIANIATYVVSSFILIAHYKGLHRWHLANIGFATMHSFGKHISSGD